MDVIKVLCVIGTRPEIIKMAPIIWELKKSTQYEVTILNTAQHREIVDDMLVLFNIKPDIDINVMQKKQTLASLSGHLFLKLNEIFQQHRYQFVLVQGDTTTALVVAQVAFYYKIPFGHVEAGLRSGDIFNPFPEEMNRVVISKIATLNFAPTNIEKELLGKEGVKPEFIYVTGNTVIDALYYCVNKASALPLPLPNNKRIILLTLHRRESHGEVARDIFQAFLELVDLIPDIHLVYPVHPNPNIHDVAYAMLDKHPAISLFPPLRYDAFVTVFKQAYLVCTDSGGVQEEAPALNKPLLILRELTERPLVVSLGLAKLAGVKKNKIVKIAKEILSDQKMYEGMKKNISPYGDGHAAEKIVSVIKQFLLK